ncbi:MAG: UDP-2,3-diacylglucosamine diphosphatase [Bacteroidota bacterium]
MGKRKRRKVDLVVLSDIHLGTYGCRARELLSYLRSINPSTLVLNGDIIDVWQFSKRFFPSSHLQIIKYITTLLTKGTRVYYITGNHDELFRRFAGFELGGLKIVNKLLLDLDGKKAWIFHGDVFDVVMNYSKWLARLGGKGYDLLIFINSIANRVSQWIGYGRISLSKRVKNSVKGAVKYVNNYEKTAIEIGMLKDYDYVVCGHIHQPRNQLIDKKNGRQIRYLNSGDWVENMSALEYQKGKWSIYYYNNDKIAQGMDKEVVTDIDLARAEYKYKDIFRNLVDEFQILPSAKGKFKDQIRN